MRISAEARVGQGGLIRVFLCKGKKWPEEGEFAELSEWMEEMIDILPSYKSLFHNDKKSCIIDFSMYMKRSGKALG